MVNITIDLDEDLNKDIRLEMAEKGETNKKEFVLKVLKERYINGQK